MQKTMTSLSRFRSFAFSRFKLNPPTHGPAAALSFFPLLGGSALLLTLSRPSHEVIMAEQTHLQTGMKFPGPFTLVLFGATGDLAGRKLFPSLAGLFAEK